MHSVFIIHQINVFLNRENTYDEDYFKQEKIIIPINYIHIFLKLLSSAQ